MTEKNLKKNLSIILISIFFISTFPISILLPSSFINIYTVFISILFLYLAIQNKIYDIFNDLVFKLLFLYWMCLIVVLFFSIDINNSLSRTLGFFRFIILTASIIYFFQYKNYKFANTIFVVWLIVFFIITLDLFLEYFTGNNILGYSADMGGRLSGVLNDELKIGNYYLGFYLISISTVITLFKNQKLIIFFSIILFTIAAFLIGERANFLRVLVSLLIFLIIWKRNEIKKILTIFLFLIVAIFFVFKSDEQLNTRYGYQFWNVISDGGITHYLQKSQYGAHYAAAYQMFVNYPFAGIGLKNFNLECKDNQYNNVKFQQTNLRCANHPHQIHLEILSHTGIFTYLSFLILFTYFISRGFFYFKKNNNLFHLSGVIFVFTMIFLPLPTGSFFTTYSATIFWINFALAIALERRKDIN